MDCTQGHRPSGKTKLSPRKKKGTKTITGERGEERQESPDVCSFCPEARKDTRIKEEKTWPSKNELFMRRKGRRVEFRKKKNRNRRGRQVCRGGDHPRPCRQERTEGVPKKLPTKKRSEGRRVRGNSASEPGFRTRLAQIFGMDQKSEGKGQ